MFGWMVCSVTDQRDATDVRGIFISPFEIAYARLYSTVFCCCQLLFRSSLVSQSTLGVLSRNWLFLTGNRVVHSVPTFVFGLRSADNSPSLRLPRSILLHNWVFLIFFIGFHFYACYCVGRLKRKLTVWRTKLFVDFVLVKFLLDSIWASDGSKSKSIFIIFILPYIDLIFAFVEDIFYTILYKYLFDDDNMLHHDRSYSAYLPIPIYFVTD